MLALQWTGRRLPGGVRVSDSQPSLPRLRPSQYYCRQWKRQLRHRFVCARTTRGWSRDNLVCNIYPDHVAERGVAVWMLSISCCWSQWWVPRRKSFFSVIPSTTKETRYGHKQRILGHRNTGHSFQLKHNMSPTLPSAPLPLIALYCRNCM